MHGATSPTLRAAPLRLCVPRPPRSYLALTRRDHNIYAGFKLKQYAQWRSWMRILRTLREHFPEMVMDHRQVTDCYCKLAQLAAR